MPQFIIVVPCILVCCFVVYLDLYLGKGALFNFYRMDVVITIKEIGEKPFVFLDKEKPGARFAVKVPSALLRIRCNGSCATLSKSGALPLTWLRFVNV